MTGCLNSGPTPDAGAPNGPVSHGSVDENDFLGVVSSMTCDFTKHLSCERFFALDEKTGQVKWEFSPSEDNHTEISSAKPNLHGDTIFVHYSTKIWPYGVYKSAPHHGGVSRLLAFDAQTGSQRWAHEVRQNYDGGGGTHLLAVSETMAYVDDYQYSAGQQASEKLVALDLKTGEKKWAVSMKEDPGEALLVGGTLFVALTAHNTDRSMLSIDAATGAVLKTFRYFPAVDSIYFVENGTIVTRGHTGDDQTIYAYDAEGAKTSWKWGTWNVAGGSYEAPVFAAGRMIFTWKTKLLAMHLSNGTQSWEHAEPETAGSSGGHLATDGNLVVGAFENGNLIAFEAATGQVKWVANARNARFAAPAFNGDSIVVSTSLPEDPSTHQSRHALRALNRDTGAAVWESADQEFPSGRLAIEGETIFASNDDGSAVHAFDATNGELRWKGPPDSLRKG